MMSHFRQYIILKQQNQVHNFHLTFQNMKQLTKQAIADLSHILPKTDLAAFTQRLQKQSQNQINSNPKNDSMFANTPSTAGSVFRRSGCAISKSRKNKIISRENKERREDVEEGEKSQNQQNENELMQSNHYRKIMTDRAVYYGQVELPYLHSSDAISSLYGRSKNSELSEPLLNPSPNISPNYLTTVKNLSLYYTNLDSLRQLGTGWSGLKSLSVMCSINLKDLSGLSIFPALQYLFAPHNCINDISDIMYHSTIKCVDLSNNELQLIEQVEYLYTINQLEWVDITNNPISQNKQKWRIVAENLGNKMESEEFIKDVQYLDSCENLDYEIASHENIEVSNALICEFNKLSEKDSIKIGSLWRNLKVEQSEESENLINYYSSYEELEENYSHLYEEQIYQQLQTYQHSDYCSFSLTPLSAYSDKSLNLKPLHKYFLNKVFPQASIDKVETGRGVRKLGPRKFMKSPDEKLTQTIKNSHDLQDSNKASSIMQTRKFAATQNISNKIHMSEQKQKRETSLSFNNKRLKKLSLSKNIHSVASSQMPGNHNEGTLLKFKNQSKSDMLGASKILGKRRLLGNHHHNSNMNSLLQGNQL